MDGEKTEAHLPFLIDWVSKDWLILDPIIEFWNTSNLASDDSLLGFPNVARNSMKITLASHDLVDKEALKIIKNYVNHGMKMKGQNKKVK